MHWRIDSIQIIIESLSCDLREILKFCSLQVIPIPYYIIQDCLVKDTTAGSLFSSIWDFIQHQKTHTHKKKKLTTRCQMCSVLDNEWTWNFSKLWSVCIAHRGFMVLISLQGVNISTPKNILILTLLKWNRTLKFWLEPSPSKLTECPSRKEPRF